MSPTQGQADINGGNPFPAISQPLWGQLYGWLPLSNAYGIPFRCNTIHNQTTNGIFFRCSKTHNQTTYGIFFRRSKYLNCQFLFNYNLLVILDEYALVRFSINVTSHLPFVFKNLSLQRYDDSGKTTFLFSSTYLSHYFSMGHESVFFITY